MALDQLFELRTIAGKRLYVVDDHHKALAAWALERRRLECAPNLITIDHHTDTFEAFRSHICVASFSDPTIDEGAMEAELISRIDWRDDDSVLAAIAILAHDEHIHAATMSGALGSSFSIQLSDDGGIQSLEQLARDGRVARNFALGIDEAEDPVEPMTYAARADRIYVVPFKCAMGCVKRPYDEECYRHHVPEIIESRYLNDQLRRVALIGRSIGQTDIEEHPYILDIDLDAFHCVKATEPDDASTFHRLIRGAVAITIATEAQCVEDLWIGAERMQTPELLARIVAHIEAALDFAASRPDVSRFDG